MNISYVFNKREVTWSDTDYYAIGKALRKQLNLPNDFSNDNLSTSDIYDGHNDIFIKTKDDCNALIKILEDNNAQNTSIYKWAIDKSIKLGFKRPNSKSSNSFNRNLYDKSEKIAIKIVETLFKDEEKIKNPLELKKSLISELTKESFIQILDMKGSMDSLMEEISKRIDILGKIKKTDSHLVAHVLYNSLNK